jgi:hypothetical protein
MFFDPDATHKDRELAEKLLFVAMMVALLWGILIHTRYPAWVRAWERPPQGGPALADWWLCISLYFAAMIIPPYLFLFIFTKQLLTRIVLLILVIAVAASIFYVADGAVTLRRAWSGAFTNQR